MKRTASALSRLWATSPFDSFSSFFFFFFASSSFFDRRRSVKFPQISLSFCVLSSDDEERNVKTTTTYEHVKFGPKFF